MNANTYNNKKNIHKPTVEKKTTFKNKMGLKLAALAIALGISAFHLYDKTENTLTLGVTKDVVEDNYEKSIPLYADAKGQTILTTVGDGKLIIAQDNLTIDNNKNRLHLISVINNNDKMVTGYTYKKYLEQTTELSKDNAYNLYKVTSKNGVILRKDAEISDNKLASIPENSILIGAKSKDDEYKWTNVVYLNGGNIQQGYVSGKFLEPVNDFKSHFANINTKSLDLFAPEENEFGIDVSHIKPAVLDKLLQGKISLPERPERISGKKANLSQFNREIKFVYIKALGTAPFSKDLKRGKDTPYLELAKVCEKNKIPFGIYLYSTCTTLDEAKQEHKWFSEVLNKVKDNPYHKLPVAIDVEVANNKDRHHRASVKNVTNSKIHLANLLENEFGKTILYTPRNAYSNELDSKILDLDQYHSGLESGDTHIWHVTPIDNALHKKSMLSISDSVTANQIALDVKVDGTKNNLVDVNIMNKKAFEEYVSGKYVALAKNNKGLNTNSKASARDNENER